MKVYFVYCQEGGSDDTIWNGVYDSKEKAQAVVDDLEENHFVIHAAFEEFEVL
jgi:hypothetical protein